MKNDQTVLDALARLHFHMCLGRHAEAVLPIHNPQKCIISMDTGASGSEDITQQRGTR